MMIDDEVREAVVVTSHCVNQIKKHSQSKVERGCILIFFLKIPDAFRHTVTSSGETQLQKQKIWNRG